MKITIDALTEGMEVEFDYHAPERQTWDHPGCASSVDVTGLMLSGVDVYELVAALKGIHRVEELVLEAYEQQLQEDSDDAQISRYEWSKSA